VKEDKEEGKGRRSISGAGEELDHLAMKMDLDCGSSFLGAIQRFSIRSQPVSSSESNKVTDFATLILRVQVRPW
jgi:hypothetical protein